MAAGRRATVCFTDIEGSTALLRELGGGFDDLLDQHNRILGEAFARFHGEPVRSEGDSLLVVFPDAAEAIIACVDAQRTLRAASWPDGIELRVRMALHTGSVHGSGADVRGLTIHQAARVLVAAHGGQILCTADTVADAGDRLAPGVTLANLGGYHVRDFDGVANLYEVRAPGIASGFGPLRGVRSPARALPRYRTTFVGRDDDVRRVVKATETARLVTIVGPGGTGKTRLALEVASVLAESTDEGAVAALLADVASDDGVTGRVAESVGVVEQQALGLEDALVANLRDRALVLVLDNCEHVATGCARLVDRVLNDAPSVVVVATSRRPLGVPGEAVHQLGPLAVPAADASPEEIALAESVQLLVDRATITRPDFAVTTANAPALAAICRAVDGLPLALELAAGRLRSLPASEVAARLETPFSLLTARDGLVDERHRTLWSVIDWSHELLDAPTGRFFAALSVFRGGFTLDAAHAVAGRDGIDVLDAIETLSEHSLVMIDSADRYQMYAVITAYAASKADELGISAETRRRHLSYFAALAERVSAVAGGPEELEVDAVVGSEIDNIRAAASFAFDGIPGADPSDDDRAHGVALVTGLVPHLLKKALLREGEALLAKARAACDALDVEIATRVAVLLGQARFAYAVADYESSRHLADEALPLAQETGDATLAARAALVAGNARFGLGESAAAASLFDEALTAARRSGHRATLTAIMLSAGNLARLQREKARAVALFEEGLALSRAANDRRAVSRFLLNLGGVAFGDEDFNRARVLFEEAYALFEELDDPGPTMLTLLNLADLDRRAGELDRCRSRIEQARSMALVTGDRFVLGACADKLGEMELVLGNHGRAAARFEESISAARAAGDRRMVATRTTRLARTLHAMGDAAGALDRMRESLAIAESIDDVATIEVARRDIEAWTAGERDRRSTPT